MRFHLEVFTRTSKRLYSDVAANRLAVLIVALTAAFLCASPALFESAAQTEGAAIINGVIQDDRGSPVADAKVVISSADLTSSVRTQADGKFEFRNLKVGQYRLTTEAARFRKDRVTANIARPDEAVPLVIKLSPSSLHVAVYNVNNQPLGGVTVAIYAQDRGAIGSLVERRVTDESGDAYFGRLAPGSYQLTAVLRGFDEYRNEVFISSDITTDFPLRLLIAPVIPINEKAAARCGVPMLPSKNVQTIFQDSEGWVWFGTDRGIARFNSIECESTAASASQFERLLGEDVRSIIEDRDGAIWLATARGARKITKEGAEVDGSLSGYDARHLFSDSAGAVWVATSQGAFKYDGKSFASIDQTSGLPSNDVRAIVQDRAGKIWMATARGIAVHDGERTIHFDEWRSDAQTAGLTDNARALLVDSAGVVWFATDKGVWTFDGNRVAPVEAPALPKAAGTGAGVRAIGQDRMSRMWFALEQGGAVLYDPARRESQRVSFLEGDNITAIYTGREGNTWFGTANGVVCADLYSFVNFNTSRGLSDNDVRAVVEGPGTSPGEGRGRLWFVTASGASRMENERFVPVERFPPNVSVRAVAFDREGSSWFATEQGVFRLSGRTLTQLNEGNGLASNNVRWVTALASGSSIVFATSKGASIYEDGSMRSIEALAGYDVHHVFEDTDGKLWFATTRGVVSINPKSGETDVIDTARGLADNDTRWIARFNEKLLLATRAGIQVYNSRERNPMAFAVFDGGAASTMYVDRDGFLWVGTDDGQVKKFALAGGYIVSSVYSGETHALTASRINSISEDSSGQIWVATNKGAVRHLPVRVEPVTRVSFKTADGAAEMTGPGTHTLPHGHQRLTFYFTAASMTGQVRYLYRMSRDTGERPWTLLPLQPGAEREVPWFDLDTGAHSFEVVALNRDLYGAGAPPSGLSLRVGQPFWNRWWFYTLALALIAATCAAVVAARRLREREYVLPKELRSYVPVEPNPYIVGNPIRTEKMFFGREDDFRYVRTKLEGVNQGVVIVFCGERRVGKSSILYQVLNGRLGERFIPVFVDMQEMVISSDSEFFARISRLIAEAVNRAGGLEERRGAALAGTSYTAAPRAAAQAVGAQLRVPVFDGRNPYTVFIDFLDEVLRVIGDRTLLILMDEYELLEAKVDEGKISPELFTFLAGLMDNKERLALIFTGSRRLEERDRKYWRELLRRSLFRKVGFLSEKDTSRLITEPVEGRVVFGRGVIDVIYRLTAGQPFYTQVTCQNIVDYLNEHRQNWVTLSDLQQVIAEIVDNPLPQMIYTWDVLSDDEKLVLSLLGERLSDGVSFAAARELRDAVKANDYPVNLSSNTIRLTLEEMFRRELLEKDATEGFRFKIDLLRLWIRRSHSIWQVVKEVRTL